MKKLIFSLAIVTIAALSANAQTDKSSSTLKVDVGVSGGIPTGDFGNAVSFGIGGYAKGSYAANENVDITLTADYKSFSGKNSGPSAGLLTFLAGGTYNMDGGFHVDGGIGFGSESVSFDGESASASGFAYRVGAGYLINNALDITANYDGVSVSGGSLGYIGIGIGYRIVK